MRYAHATAAFVGYAVVIGLAAHVSWCLRQGRKPLAALHLQH
jgi:hypothetical protein